MSTPPTVVAMRDPRGPETLFAAAPDAAPPAAASRAADRPRSAAWPLTLGLLALLGALAHQAWLQEQERQQLQATRAALQPTLDRAQQLRQSLDALAADTQRLADTGHPHARTLVDELKRRGVTIQPGAAAPAPEPGRTAPATPPGR